MVLGLWFWVSGFGIRVWFWTTDRVKVRLRRLEGFEELFVKNLADFSVLALSRYLM